MLTKPLKDNLDDPLNCEDLDNSVEDDELDKTLKDVDIDNFLGDDDGVDKSLDGDVSDVDMVSEKRNTSER